MLLVKTLKIVIFLKENYPFQEIEHRKKRKIVQTSMKNCMFFRSAILQAFWHDIGTVLGGQNPRFLIYFRLKTEAKNEMNFGRQKIAF